MATSDTLLKGRAAHGVLKPAYAILDKPFDRSRLLNTIRDAVRGLPRPSMDLPAQQGVTEASMQSQSTFHAFA